MHQLILIADEEILRALLVKGEAHVNEVVRLVKRNKRTVIKRLERMEEHGLVASEHVGKKKIYRLTEKGRDICSVLRIKAEAGAIGLEWAEEKMARGWRVRVLEELTGLSNHRKWLFAWNPETGECDLAAVFGVRSLMGKPNAPRYVAQLVDRKKSPDRPLKHAELFEFLKENVKDWGSEENIKRALKSFWDPRNFNTYICAFAPEEIRFGFPQEIGHFSTLMFVGFGFQEHFPFIPRMTIVAGTFNLSENLAVQLEYDMNLMMLYIFSWLVAKEAIAPGSVPEETLDKAKVSTFDLRIGVACKNIADGKCKKMGIRCVAKTNGSINFSWCPILLEEAKQVEVTYSMKDAT